MNYQKYANTYKNGEIISKKDENGVTRDYTIQEVEELIDKLSEDKDENGKVKDPESLNNAVAILMQLYRKYGNPHEKDIIEAIKKAKEQKPLEEQKKEALEEVKEQLSDSETKPKDASTMYNEEYVDFEEIKEDETKESAEQTTSAN